MPSIAEVTANLVRVQWSRTPPVRVESPPPAPVRAERRAAPRPNLPPLKVPAPSAAALEYFERSQSAIQEGAEARREVLESISHFPVLEKARLFAKEMNTHQATDAEMRMVFRTELETASREADLESALANVVFERKIWRKAAWIASSSALACLSFAVLFAWLWLKR